MVARFLFVRGLFRSGRKVFFKETFSRRTRVRGVLRVAFVSFVESSAPLPSAQRPRAEIYEVRFGDVAPFCFFCAAVDEERTSHCVLPKYLRL